MALNGAPRDEITRRREEVARFRLRGMSQREISIALSKLVDDDNGLMPIVASVATVNRDLKILTAEWRVRAAEAIDKRKARQLAEIDEAKRLAWLGGDLTNLLRAIKLESDIFGTMAPKTVELRTWEDRVIDLLRQGMVQPAEVVTEYGAELAIELFKRAGVTVAMTDDTA